MRVCAFHKDVAGLNPSPLDEERSSLRALWRNGPFRPDCNGPPEAIERPALVGKVGEKCEREANRQLPFDWCQPGLLCNFVDRSARIRNSDMPNRILARYAERNDS